MSGPARICRNGCRSGPRSFPLCGPRFFGFARGLAKAIEAQRPDAIELHGLWKFTSIALLQARRKLGCPTVVHPHGMLDPWAVRNSGWKKRLAAWAYERRNLEGGSCIRALNQAEAAAIRAYGLRNPICVVPNGTDLPEDQVRGERCQVSEEQVSGERCQVSEGDDGGISSSSHLSPLTSHLIPSPFPAGRKVLLYLGRIHPKKNLVNLLRAWSIVSSSSHLTPNTSHLSPDSSLSPNTSHLSPDSSLSPNTSHLTPDSSLSPNTSHLTPWLLAIAGWDQGGHEAELRRCAEELGLNESVTFLGPRFGGQKAACYRHCEAFVLPSLSEGLPIVVLEAWSYAKPVLMTDQCNLPEGFSKGGAIRVDASPQEIARGIHVLQEMSDCDRQTMGECGRAIVEAGYTWPQVARQMREVYDWLLGGGPPPAHVEFR